LKLHEYAPNLLAFFCPGCGYDHAVTVNGRMEPYNATWGWNGSMEQPTFTPSLLVNAHYPETRCHSFVKDGKIQYLSDCYHKLKGQTVEIPEWED